MPIMVCALFTILLLTFTCVLQLTVGNKIIVDEGISMGKSNRIGFIFKIAQVICKFDAKLIYMFFDNKVNVHFINDMVQEINANQLCYAPIVLWRYNPFFV